MVSYRDLEQWRGGQSVEQPPAEIHGLLTGWLCAGASWDKAGRLAAISEWLDVELGSDDFALLDSLYNETAEGIIDEEFGFRLLVPEDDRDVNTRTQEVAAWCSGFLYGFGMTGKFRKEDLSEDVAEVLSDLGRIATIADDVPEDEDNESDLVEIIEYVRMSAMLIYAECAQRAVH